MSELTPLALSSGGLGAVAAHLRPTMVSDLDYVLSLERDPLNLPFITPWERTQHEAALRIPDFRHFIIEAGQSSARCGFVIVQGCRNPHRSVELKRMVLQHKRKGMGRSTVSQIKRLAFDSLGAHRLWLDVKALNTPAQQLYRRMGFVEEGRLRDSVRLDDTASPSYDSLIVMSMLEHEYRSRQAQGVEATR